MRVPLIAVAVALAAAVSPIRADHVGAHTTPCNEPDTVGGGELGVSPGPAPPAATLGWDVGNGQCNGSFSTVLDESFPSAGGGGIELGLRAEQRSVGQVARQSGNDYEVETGNDTTSGNNARAWWNFQFSAAYDGDIDDLDSLSLSIRTDVGANLSTGQGDDLLAIRGPADARQNNGTATFSDLYQSSQNPEFGWFVNLADGDANPTTAFDYDEEGAWLFTLAAEKDGHRTSVSMCIHTPNAACASLPVHLQCYSVDEIDKLGKIEVSLDDEFASVPDAEVKKAKELCVPVEKNGEGLLPGGPTYVCYDIKGGADGDVDVLVTNQFGEQALEVKKARRLCVPSTREVLDEENGD